MNTITYYINRLPQTYLSIDCSPKSSFFGKDKYYAKFFWHDELSHIIKIHPDMVNQFSNHYKYFFEIANRPLCHFSNEDINNNFPLFIESSIYQNMWGFFMGGEDIYFKEITDGFILKSYRNQFVIEATGESASLKIHTHYDNYPNYNKDIETTLTREQAELFIAVIGFRVYSNGLFPNAWGTVLKKEIGKYSTLREFIGDTFNDVLNVSKCFIRYYKNGYYN